MATIHELNEQFSRDNVRFEAGQGGLVRAVINSPQAQGEIYLHGAHITQFQPAGHAPVLFLSEESNFAPDKAIRGGVPICFPWFGPRQGDESAPMHGLARLVEWDVESVSEGENATQIVLRYAPASPPHPAWPHCELRYLVTFGSALKMQLEVKNIGDKSFTFEEALHTYFQVGDARQIEIRAWAKHAFSIKRAIFKKTRNFTAACT